MAASPFHRLVDHFPLNEHDEALVLLGHLGTIPHMDTWRLAKLPATVLSIAVSGFPDDHFDAVWEPVQQRAADAVTEVAPADPNDLTTDERTLAETLLGALWNSYVPAKRNALIGLIERVVDGPLPEAWPLLNILADTDLEDVRAARNDVFHLRLASYYLEVTNDYIARHAQEYVCYGMVTGGGKPVSLLAPGIEEELEEVEVRAAEPPSEPSWRGNGLPNVRVHCFDPAEGRSFGFAVTNALGAFKVRFTVLHGVVYGDGYDLRFVLEHRDATEPVDKTETFFFEEGTHSNKRKPIAFSVPLSKTGPFSNTIEDTGVEVPEDVTDYLDGQSITLTYLADIRRLGGLYNLPTKDINKEDPDLLKLDGLAALEMLETDLAVIEPVYDAGYSGLTAIANASRAAFVRETAGVLGDYAAAQLHYKARVAHFYALHAHAGNEQWALKVSSALFKKGKPKEGSLAAIGKDPEVPIKKVRSSGCNCPECESAVSPLAYLTDLLLFTTNNLVKDGGSTALGLTFLEESFHLPFADLRVECAQLEERLCQNRIATEVLRSYIEELSPTPEQMAALAAAEKQYLTDTYELLLNKLGTSYTEIRQMRGVADAEERKRVTDRLGIVAIYPGDPDTDTLRRLFIDLSDLNNISEPLLEEIFGLRDSNHEVLQPTPECEVERWKKARLREIWVEQHRLKNDYWDPTDRAVVIDPDVVTADDFRYPEVGDEPDTHTPFALWLKRRNWLNAILNPLPWYGSGDPVEVPLVDHRASGNVIVLYADDPVGAPFGEEDRAFFVPDTAITYSTVFGGVFEQEYTVASARLVDGNIELTVRETIEVDRGQGTIAWTIGPSPITEPHVNEAIRTFTAPDLPSIFGLMLTGNEVYPTDPAPVTLEPDWETPVGDSGIDALFAHFRERAGAVRNNQINAIDSLWEDFHLEAAELLWLVDLLDTYEGYPVGVHAQNNHDIAKWHELRNILVNVFKRLADETWRTEENADGIMLGPQDFWTAVHPPRSGPWPIFNSAEVPLIDPELVGLRDLPEITVRKAHPFSLHAAPAFGPVVAPALPDTDAFGVHDARRKAISSARNAIQAAYHDQQDFMAMLDLAFALPPPGMDWADYQVLLAQLLSADGRDTATALIEGTLRIAPDEFIFVMGVGERRFSGQEIPERDLTRLFNIMTGARKRNVLYPAWIEQERYPTNPDLVVAGIQQQWKLRKAALPPWTASPERRSAWVQALAENSERPIIDPDLIGPGDIRNPVPSNYTFFLWNALRQAFQTFRNNIVADPDSALDNTSELDGLTQTYLAHAETSLAEIRVQQEEGVDIRPRLAQLSLTFAGFNQLMTCRDILTSSPGTLTPEEKASVIDILISAVKKRLALGVRVLEMEPIMPSAAITLSQDFFLIREQAIGSFPPQVEYPLKPWLAEERDLILWRRQLRGRMEQEKSVTDAWQTVLFDVDEAMVVHLRDALVQACGDPSLRLIDNARNLGDLLLIDLENNCCHKTNRVAAAIETLQQLLWKTRTGDILHHHQIRFDGEDFDGAWTWMGSYANWRAAMFVFLYPENVMHPSLRRQQTPAFQEVVQATRNNRRFDDHAACQAVHLHRSYIRDVSDLELACAVVAEVLLGKKGCGDGGHTRRRHQFVFAKARGSGKVYFTTADAKDPEHVTQESFWAAVPNIDDGVQITGCDFYRNDDQEVRHVYLFFLAADDDVRDRFFAIRYDVDTHEWDSEPLEFEIEVDDLRDHGTHPETLPDDAFLPEIQAMAVLKNNYQWDIPFIAISLKENREDPRIYTFHSRLHANGKELVSKEWWDRWYTYKPSPQQLWEQSASGTVPASLEGRIIDFVSVNMGTGLWEDNLQFFLLHYNVDGQERSKIVRIRLGTDGHARYHAVYLPLYPIGEGPGTPQDIEFIHHLLVDPRGDWFAALASYAYEEPEARPTHSLVFTEAIFDHQQDPYPIHLAPFVVEWDLPAPAFMVAWPSPKIDLQEKYAPLWYQSEADKHIRMTWVWAGHFDEDYPENTFFIWGDDKLRVTPRLNAPAGGAPLLESLASVGNWINNEDPNPRLLQYVWELHYFVPMQVALQLQVNGHYQAAMDRFREVYDITLSTEGKIFYGLVVEETIVTDGTILADWYRDPLNPHAIAATRQHAYTRYTLMAIAQCLLDWADSEFTTDTSETVPRARELYEDALRLLQLLVPTHHACPIQQLLDLIPLHGIPQEWVSTWTEVLLTAEPVSHLSSFQDLVNDINHLMAGTDPIAEELAAVIALIEAALAAADAPPTVGGVLGGHIAALEHNTAILTADAGTDTAIQFIGLEAEFTFDQTITAVTGHTLDLEAMPMPWFADHGAGPGVPNAGAPDPVTFGPDTVLELYTGLMPGDAFITMDPIPNIWFSGVALGFCVVPNPIIGALVMKAEVELWKIHNCMNIAGMVRELDPFAAPTDSTSGIPVIGAGGGTLAVPNARSIPPSAYRYRVLVDRARQLVGMAQQVEAAFLSTLEKLDAERYSQLRAEQDVATSKANIKLQDLKVNEANSGVDMAELQRDRAVIQSRYFNDRISEGLIAYEEDAMALLRVANTLQIAASTSFFTAAVASGFAGKFHEIMTNTGNALNAIANGLSSQAQLWQTLATFERRKQEWEFNRDLADQDIKIGQQQIKLAKDRVRIVGQEREIAVLQNDHAKATLDFLKNKFTNAELYEWMSRILEDVYAWFLQEATSMAVLAQRQLAFERQIDLPPFVRTDYWVVDPNQLGNSMTGEGNTDRRGLTGSTRLLKDLTELDQYAFNTNSPKLQLSKTISLNEIAPEELMALRDGGIANFRTTHELFDRDYPGHYLRLIKKVSVTVIALNPPTKGIRATLTNGGVSYVWTGGTLFQERVINRLPEQIALSGGVGDYGVFQLRGEGEFLDPFEGTGVDTQWEFRMEKAANPFDYNSIADVLITIEYEALNSFLWRNTVVQRLNGEDATAALALSMKHNLPDQWFDLHNPEQTETPYMVNFQISERDLAPNITDAQNTAIGIYFLMKDGATFSSSVTLGTGEALFEATPNDNLISTRASGGGLNGLVGEYSPVNTWTFGLADTQETQGFFAEDKIDDILIIFSYSGVGAKYSF